MRPLFRVSLRERIRALLLGLLVFTARCTLSALLLVALVYACIQLISWVTAPSDCAPSSTGVLVWDSDLGVWEVKGLFLCHGLRSESSKN